MTSVLCHRRTVQPPPACDSLCDGFSLSTATLFESFARFEGTLRAAAGLLHDLVRIDRAIQLRDTLDRGASGTLGGSARGERGRAELVRLGTGQRAVQVLLPLLKVNSQSRIVIST